MNMQIPKELLSSPYRREMWKNAKRVIIALEKVVPISEVHLTGSFITKKRRPADVDFMIQLQIKEKDVKKKWSVDLVTAPNNKYGKDLLKDNQLWMKQKYGKKYLTIKIK